MVDQIGRVRGLDPIPTGRGTESGDSTSEEAAILPALEVAFGLPLSEPSAQ